MIYELRIYKAAPGRLADINARFEKYTIPLFKELGLHICDYFVDTTLEKLYYVMSFEDEAQKDAQWKLFQASPKWAEIVKITQANGKIVDSVESFMMTRPPFAQSDWK